MPKKKQIIAKINLKIARGATFAGDVLGCFSLESRLHDGGPLRDAQLQAHHELVIFSQHFQISGWQVRDSEVHICEPNTPVLGTIRKVACDQLCLFGVSDDSR